MQNCFREYPEVYGSELEGDDAEEEEDRTPSASAPTATHSESVPAVAYSDSTTAPASRESSSRPAPQHETSAADKGKQSGERNSKPHSAESASENRSKLGLVPDNYKPDAKTDTERANQAATHAKSHEPTSESEQLVPKAAHDAGDANTERLQRK
jgi:intermembrane space import and assembly protein 40